MRLPREQTGFRMADVLQVVTMGVMLAAGAGWWLYDRRPRERIPGGEGMDDVAMAEQFAEVAVPEEPVISNRRTASTGKGRTWD